MKDTIRHIVLKVVLNEDESLQIRKWCASVGKTGSAAGRELLLMASTPAHVRPRRAPGEWPKHGQVTRRFPAQRAGSCRPMRL